MPDSLMAVLRVTALGALTCFLFYDAFGQPVTSANANLALVGGTIYADPTQEPLRRGVVLIEDGTIAAFGSASSVRVPSDVESVDCAGLIITAGFWNSHVHLFERKWAQAAEIPGPELERQLRDTFSRFGFTSVFDTGSPWENTRRIRDRIESGEVNGPSIRSTGEALIAPGAMPADRILAVLGFMPFPTPEITDGAQAAAAARNLLEAGVDGIKIHLQPPPPPAPPLPESAISAAAREAHRVHKPAFVHPNTSADVLMSVRAGVDVVAHTTPRSGRWDETIVAAMKEHDVALTPTLTLWKSAMRHDRVSVQEQLTHAAIDQLRAWLAADGTVLFGTDVGAVDSNPTEEYALMAEAGMSFRQILTSLTTAPAERFGESGETGRIAVGQEADLVVLEEDPSEDVRALASVRYTIRAGQIIYER